MPTRMLPFLVNILGFEQVEIPRGPQVVARTQILGRKELLEKHTSSPAFGTCEDVLFGVTGAFAARVLRAYDEGTANRLR